MLYYMPDMIKEATLRELVRAKSINSACLVGQFGGYVVKVRYGASERLLATTRSEVRLFTLENAGKFLRTIGLPRFEVDATTYEPGLLRKARPDRAEALRNTRTVMRQASLIA
jgi:hypothetical protein